MRYGFAREPGIPFGDVLTVGNRYLTVTGYSDLAA